MAGLDAAIRAREGDGGLAASSPAMTAKGGNERRWIRTLSSKTY